MGSQPWKQRQLRRWDDAFDGVIVRVAKPGRIINRDDETVTLDVVEGKYLGSGAIGGLPCIFIHTKPEMRVRDEGFWSHELTILLQSKDMEVASREKGQTDA